MPGVRQMTTTDVSQWPNFPMSSNESDFLCDHVLLQIRVCTFGFKMLDDSISPVFEEDSLADKAKA